MEIFISIDGVLRNTIQKIEYHYNNYYLDSETVTEDDFDYKVTLPITNNNLLDHFNFQSKEEFDNFLFIEFPLEIFGHSGISYPTVITDLNNIIHQRRDINFTIVGMDELGKAKPSTLFFLSRNGFLGYNIKFINSSNLKKEWRKCDMWITDNETIIKSCPRKITQKFRKKKIAIKFNTLYNTHFTTEIEINKLTEIPDL